MEPTPRQPPDPRRVAFWACALAVEARVRAEHIQHEARRTREEVRRTRERLRHALPVVPPPPDRK